MVALDWNKLMGLDVQSLDDDGVEDMYNVLAEFEVGAESNTERLKKLFEVTRHIMLSKALAAEVAIEHMTELKANEGKSLTKKAQEIEELHMEMTKLKKRNKELEQQHPGLDSAGPASMDMRQLRDANYELENQVGKLHIELTEKDAQLGKEKRDSAELVKQVDDSAKRLREMKIENDQLHDEIHDLKRQLDALRDTMVSRRDGDQEVRQDIATKNRLLNNALDENRNLLDRNSQLEDEIERLHREMRDAEKEIEKTTDEYLRIKRMLENHDADKDSVANENKILKAQLDDLRQQKELKSAADDEIMQRVDTKVQEWHTLLSDKDDTILQLQRQLAKMRDDLVAANMDTQKSSIAALSKACAEKDKQIELLSKHLKESEAEVHENTALLNDMQSRITQVGGGTADASRRRILELQAQIKELQEQLVDLERSKESAEADARAKDKEVSETHEKMLKYERGIYGLPEAVSEIKQCKGQVRERERTIEELTQYMNRCEQQMNDLYDEAEELRERLGLDPKEPIDLREIRHKKSMHLQQDRALNRVLQKEIEKLEEERLELKQQMRKLAQSTGQKAVAMGLTADQVAAVDAFMEHIKATNDLNPPKSVLASLRAGDVKTDDRRLRDRVVSDDSEKSAHRINQLHEECTELKIKNEELEEENHLLGSGLKEIKQQLSSGAPLQAGPRGGDSTSVHGERSLSCAPLDKLLAAMESRSIVGRYDKSVILKAQVDNLTGRNEELRRELKESRIEQMRAQEELNKIMGKKDSLENEVKTLREAGTTGGWHQTLALPEGMAPTSAEVIASLNEHLIIALHELASRESMVERMEESLEGYRRKFAIMRHQQGLLYQEHKMEKRALEETVEKLKQDLNEAQGARQEDQVKINEFDRLIDTLAQDEPEVRKRLAEMSRKITVLRVNEKALTRRYTAMLDMQTTLKNENARLKSDTVAIQKAVAERLGYLQRHKDMVAFKVTGLQRALDESVPVSRLEVANAQYTELTEKYRNLLESSKSLVQHKEESSAYQLEAKRLKEELNFVTRELEVDKEKLHTLEATFENIRGKGLTRSSDVGGCDPDLLSMAHRLTTLEMKELNERQRADHAARMYEQQKNSLRELEDRNFELETKFAELTRANFELQKMERTLRDELSNSVLKSVSDADRRRINELEEMEATLRNETSKLKEVADVAAMQVHEIQSQQQLHDKELASLRQQLLDIQTQSDEKTLIGKLHRHIVQLQVSEASAIRRFEEANNRLCRLEAQSLRLEQKVDEKDQTIYHNRLESRNKQNHLKQTIQELRRKYIGAVPLADQEKFTQLVMRMQEDQAKAQEELRQASEDRAKVQDSVEEMSLQHKGLEELMATLKDGKGAQKVAEWHAKMEAVRLEDLRYKREIERLRQQVKFLEAINKKHESEVLMLEEEKVRLKKDFESNELTWEQREVELERTIVGLENQQSAIASAASQFEEAVGNLPDSSLPIIQQLDEAVVTIKRNVKLILDSKAQAEANRKRAEELEKEVREKDRELLTRDRIITDLRLRLPASSERDAMFAKITTTRMNQSHQPPGRVVDEDYENSQTVRVAHATVTSLQALLSQKDESIAKYQQLLQQSHADMAAAVSRHEEEVRQLYQQLQAKNQAAFKSFKASINESMGQPGTAVPSTMQLKQLNELEDQLAERDNTAAALRDKLRQARQEVEAWKMKVEGVARNAATEKESLRRECSEEVQRLEAKNDEMEKELADAKRELQLQVEELAAQKEANVRAPTVTMKNMVEKLKNQLALKEKQMQVLSKTVLDLRGDMVAQAQTDVKMNADQTSAEINVKRLVDKQTKELMDRVDELDGGNKKLKVELKRLKDKEHELESELEQVRDNLSKRELGLKKMKEEKEALVAEVDQLQHKIQRMGTMSRQRTETDGFHQEMDELRRKNRLLSEQLERQRLQPEKPYEMQGKDRGRPDEAVAKWAENKKQEKKIEFLKSRVKEKEVEIDKLTRTNEMMKNALDRANRDKDMLETKLRNVTAVAEGDGGSAVIRAQHVSMQGTAAPSGGGGAQMHIVQELKKSNHELQDEVASLKRQLMMGREPELDEVNRRNKFLAEKLQQMEQQMNQRHSTAAPQERGVEYRDLALREDQLQKQVIKLSEENIELRFEVEQAHKDIPRLKSRNEDLQKYVEILKAEKSQLELMSRSRESLSGLSTPSSNIRRIGESGRSVHDLEKTIALLKKVVEKTQQENERLKQQASPPPASAALLSTDHVDVLRSENQSLKGQLEELRDKVGASLSERYVSKEKGTAKIMNDYERVRKDLTKELDNNEKLRIRLSQVESLLQQREREIYDAQNQLHHEQSKKTSLGAMDAKGYKSVVQARQSEDRIRALEDENEKKTRMVADLKAVVRESATREQQLLHEKRDLEEKLAVLQRFPSAGANVSDADIRREYQVARLTIDRLENEKKELMHELQTYRRRANPAAGGPDDISEDEILRKIRTHDRLMEETVDQNTKIKMLQLDKTRLEQELDKVNNELANFGPEFFEEIEDLKYKYTEVIKKNAEYEEQLKKLSKQFGVALNIPGL